MPMEHAWYSDEQAKLRGVVVWRTPDGRKVRATQITSDKEHGTEFEDIRYVGRVVSFEYVAVKPPKHLIRGGHEM